MIIPDQTMSCTLTVNCSYIKSDVYSLYIILCTIWIQTYRLIYIFNINFLSLSNKPRWTMQSMLYLKVLYISMIQIFYTNFNVSIFVRYLCIYCLISDLRDLMQNERCCCNDHFLDRIKLIFHGSNIYFMQPKHWVPLLQHEFKQHRESTFHMVSRLILHNLFIYREVY